MSTSLPSDQPPASIRSRTLGRAALAVFAVFGVVAGGLALGNVGADEIPTPPAQSPSSETTPRDPGVLPSVDLATLETTPIKQWGVVGKGTTYSVAKSLVWDFAEIGDTIYVAGIFTGVQRNADDPTSEVVPQSYLAAFERDSGAWIPSFRPVFNRAVYTVEEGPDGNLLVGGEFTQVNGVARGGLVKVDPVTGETNAGFPTHITAGDRPMVRDIVVDGNQVYIAGQISNVHGPNGSPFRQGMARLDGLTGAIDLSFAPMYAGGVWQLAIDKDRNRIHAAGFFTSVNGQPNTARFASVTEATGAYIPGLAAYVNNQPNGQRDTVAVVYANNRVYVGGAQHIIQVLDTANNQRVGFVTSGIACNNFSPSCGFTGGGDYQVLEITENGMVLGGCHCYADNAIYNSFTNSRTRNRFAHGFDTSNNTVPAWWPQLRQPSVGTYAIFVDSNHCVYIGGDYTHRADGAYLGGFGRYCQPTLGPANLTATSVNSGVRLAWETPASPLPISYYKVYRGGTFAGDTDGLSFGFTNLTPGSVQSFTVRSVDTGGRISDPVPVSVTVAGPDTQAPTVPTDVVGTSNGQTVTLTWAPSTDLPNPGGVGMSGYLVHRDWGFVRFVADGTTFTEDNVALGNRRYEVRAIDKADNFSAPAVVNVFVGVVDNQPPTVPTGLVGAASGPTGQTVTLNWAPSTDLPNPGGVGLSGYLIHRDWEYVRFINAGTETFTEDNVALGNRRYEVRAVDKDGRYSAAAVTNVSVGVVDNQPPTVPTGLVGAASGPTGQTVTLNWAPSTDLPNPGGVGLSGYLIHRDWEFVKFVAAGTETFVDTNVPAGTRRYEVRSVDKGNRNSAPSDPLRLTVPG